MRFVVLAALLAVAFLILTSSASAAPGDTTADHVLGQGGSFTSGTCNLPASPDTNICAPYGVAVDTAGRLYVTDYANDRVLIYATPLSSSVATQIISVGVGGQPYSLAVDPSGRLFVAVSGERVLIYNTPLTSTVVSRTVTLLPGTYATGIALDSSGRLYVPDGYLARVMILNTPLTSDTVNYNIATGSGSVPTGVVVDSTGRMYVADGGRNRVAVYDNPLTSPTPDRVFGQPNLGTGSCNFGGIDAGSLCGPQGVALGPAGSLFVSDSLNHRVLQYNDPNGSCGSCDVNADTIFGQFGNPSALTCNNGGRSADSLCAPWGVAVGTNGDTWIADTNNNRVLGFDGQGCTASPSASGSVGPGGTVTTDPSGAGATACQKIQASVTTPTGGAISINVQPNGAPQYIAQQVSISAPPGTPNSPLSLTFNIDASLLGPGQDLSTINVFRNGAHVFDCSAPPGIAGPDPCVSSKATVAGGDLRFVVLTSGASVWNFGPYTPVGGTVTLPIAGSDGGVPIRWMAAIAIIAMMAVAYVWQGQRRPF